MKIRSHIILCCALFLLWTNSESIQAQKAYKTIKESIKNRNNFDNALKTVSECRKEDKYAQDPELYFLAASVYQKMNDVQNEKLYLKQAYDTATFFSSIYGIFDFTLRCDSVDQLPDEKGRVKIKYRAKNRNLLKRYYNNLRAASKFYMLKKNYATAYPFISMYLKSAKSPVLASEHYEENDPSRARLAYWATICLFQTGNYNQIPEYYDLALQDSSYRCSVIETMAKAYGEAKDTTQMLSTLRKGLREYPKYTFYFTELFDYLNTHSLYSQALQLADTMLVIDKSDLLFRYAKSVALMNMQNHDGCINESLLILNQDSTYADAYYNIGISYCNKAQRAEERIRSSMPLTALRKQKLEIQTLYQKAKPFMETYRTMKPDEKGKWAPALYRIYLNLNLGSQFEEMDKFLKDKNSSKS